MIMANQPTPSKVPPEKYEFDKAWLRETMVNNPDHKAGYFWRGVR